MLRALPGGKARRPSLSACPCTGCNFRWSTCGHNKTFACPLTRANLTHRHAAAPGFHSTASGLKYVWRAAYDNGGARARVAFASKMIENLKWKSKLGPEAPARLNSARALLHPRIQEPIYRWVNCASAAIGYKYVALSRGKKQKNCLSRGGSSVVVSALQSHFCFLKLLCFSGAFFYICVLFFSGPLASRGALASRVPLFSIFTGPLSGFTGPPGFIGCLF